MSEKITNQQLDRITTWIQERTRATCPFCGARNWSVDDELGTVPAYQTDDPRVQLDRGYTLALVTCEECGFTAPFAAKKMNLGGNQAEAVSES